MALALTSASSRALRARVYVPEVREATRKVLVTDWVEGDQLVRAAPEAIAALGVDASSTSVEENYS